MFTFIVHLESREWLVPPPKLYTPAHVQARLLAPGDSSPKRGWQDMLGTLKVEEDIISIESVK